MEALREVSSQAPPLGVEGVFSAMARDDVFMNEVGWFSSFYLMMPFLLLLLLLFVFAQQAACVAEESPVQQYFVFVVGTGQVTALLSFVNTAEEPPLS